MLVCPLILLMLVPPSLAQQDASTNGADLRVAIEAGEADGDYRAMILSAVELRDTATSAEDRIFGQRSVGRGYAFLGDYERAVEAFSDAVDAAGPGTSPRLLAEIYRDTAGLLGELGRAKQALPLIERGLDLLELPQDKELESELLVIRASILGMLGQSDEALREMVRAMNHPLSNPRKRLTRLNNRGMIYKWSGDLERALPDFQTVYEQSLAQGLDTLVVYGLLELGDIERALGDHAAARIHLDEALARTEASGDERLAVHAHTYLAELAVAKGDEASAGFHRASAERLKAEIQEQNYDNRARVLEISLEVLEREQQVERLQMERALQDLQLARSRNLALIGAIAAGLLLVVLLLVLQRNQIRKSANLELDRLANTDALTGLHNRRYFLDHLRSGMREDEGDGWLIMIDLDHFKRVNDQYGHDHGDAVLNAGAKRIQAMMRTQDVLARWGGEEFLAFLPGCNEEAARHVAERILGAIQEPPIVHGGVEHHITATAGIAPLHSGQVLDAALRHADEALLRGKQGGRNQVCFAGGVALAGA